MKAFLREIIAEQGMREGWKMVIGQVSCMLNRRIKYPKNIGCKFPHSDEGAILAEELKNTR